MRVLGTVLDLVASLTVFSIACILGLLQGIFFIVMGMLMIVEDRLFN